MGAQLLGRDSERRLRFVGGDGLLRDYEMRERAKARRRPTSAPAVPPQSPRAQLSRPCFNTAHQDWICSSA